MNLTVTDDSGASDTFSQNVTATAPPPSILSAPTDLTATVQFSGKGRNKIKTVTLNWMDNSNNETEFVIERCEETGKGKTKTCNFAEWNTVPADTTVFQDEAVTGTFKYRVKARNTNDDSGYTNEVKI